MKYKIFLPTDALNTIVKHYMVIDCLEDIKNLLILPNGGNFIIFNQGLSATLQAFTDNNSIPILSGFCVSPKTSKVKKIVLNTDLNNIRFPIIFAELLPLGFYKLFNIDSSSINSKFMPIPKETTKALFSKLYTHKSIENEIAYLDEQLQILSYMHPLEDLCIENILKKIDEHYHFEIKVEELVCDFDCSVSTIERRFKLMVGFTPKNFIYVSKFCRTVLEYVEKQATFNELPYIYSDSSHMNAVFQKFLGVSPSEICEKVANQELYIYQIINMQKSQA